MVEQTKERQWRKLYYMTMLIECVSAFARYWAVAIVSFSILAILLFIPLLFGYGYLGPALVLSDGSILGKIIALVIGVLCWVAALAPLVISLLTLEVFPGSGFFGHRYRIGARVASQREREVVVGALAQLSAQAPRGTMGPSAWFVIDSTDINAYVVGTTLYVTRELIKSPHLMPILAHELGHLNSRDSRLTLALRQLSLPFMLTLSQASGKTATSLGRVKNEDISNVGTCLFGCLSPLLFLGGGGLGLRFLKIPWARFWQERDYAADKYAARCGQKDGLIQFLEEYQFFDMAVPFVATDQPYSELRIDRLLHYAEDGSGQHIGVQEQLPQAPQAVITASNHLGDVEVAPVEIPSVATAQSVVVPPLQSEQTSTSGNTAPVPGKRKRVRYKAKKYEGGKETPSDTTDDTIS